MPQKPSAEEVTDVLSGTTKQSLAFIKSSKKPQSSSKEHSEHQQKDPSLFSMVSSPNILSKKNVLATD